MLSSLTEKYQHKIKTVEELKAIGVQPPSRVPIYYRAAAQMGDAIDVAGGGDRPCAIVGLGENTARYVHRACQKSVSACTAK